MPELPEVETTRQGIAPHILNQTVRHVHIRNRNLRWPVSNQLPRLLCQRSILAVDRRAKYILLGTEIGSVIIHLGMSGSLRVVPAASSPGPYDHIEFEFANGQCLRLRDPRRFGCVLWCKDPKRHRLLKSLGPEPLGDDFNGGYLFRASRSRKSAVKNFIMNANVVSGVGNIYASEVLFAAKIHPQRRANRISLPRYESLTHHIKEILGRAIKAGGTTLRDFTRVDGNPGYFRMQLAAYGREGEPCKNCQKPIRRSLRGQRSSYYCPYCQR